MPLIMFLVTAITRDCLINDLMLSMKPGRQKIYIFLSLLICFERECVHEQGRGRKRRRETIPKRLCIVSADPGTGLDPKTLGS